MHKNPKVSAWIGKFSDAHDLMRYVETRYDPSGNSTNQFWNEIGISWFDDDFREASMLSSGNDTLADELQEFSYGETFADELFRRLTQMRQPGMDGLILLYDFDYPNVGGQRLRSRVAFVGTFDYRK